MKKSLLTLSFIALALFSKAQEDRIFKPFKVDLAIGFAIPSGKGIKGGALLALEPKYAIMDQLALGLRMEGVMTVIDYVSFSSGESNESISIASSFSATGDYYFSNKNFRPFLGAGPGIYGLVRAAVKSSDLPDNSSATIVTESQFGALVRGGFETGHFRMALEYNIIGASDDHTKNSYLGIKISGFFGGGRR